MRTCTGPCTRSSLAPHVPTAPWIAEVGHQRSDPCRVTRPRAPPACSSGPPGAVYANRILLAAAGPDLGCAAAANRRLQQPQIWKDTAAPLEGGARLLGASFLYRLWAWGRGELSGRAPRGGRVPVAAALALWLRHAPRYRPPVDHPGCASLPRTKGGRAALEPALGQRKENMCGGGAGLEHVTAVFGGHIVSFTSFWQSLLPGGGDAAEVNLNRLCPY